MAAAAVGWASPYTDPFNTELIGLESHLQKIKTILEATEFDYNALSNEIWDATSNSSKIDDLCKKGLKPQVSTIGTPPYNSGRIAVALATIKTLSEQLPKKMEHMEAKYSDRQITRMASLKKTMENFLAYCTGSDGASSKK